MMRASVPVWLRAHICFTDRQQRRKGDGRESGWRIGGGGGVVQERRYPAADYWYHESSIKCSTALQLEFTETRLHLCAGLCVFLDMNTFFFEAVLIVH